MNHSGFGRATRGRSPVPALPAGHFPRIDVLSPGHRHALRHQRGRGDASACFDVSRCRRTRVRTTRHGGPERCPTGALPARAARARLTARRASLRREPQRASAVSVIDATTSDARIATRSAPRADCARSGRTRVGLAVDEFGTGRPSTPARTSRPGLRTRSTRPRASDRAGLTGSAAPDRPRARGPGCTRSRALTPSAHLRSTPRTRGRTAVSRPARVQRRAHDGLLPRPAATIERPQRTPFYATVAASTHTLYLADIDAGTVIVFERGDLQRPGSRSGLQPAGHALDRSRPGLPFSSADRRRRQAHPLRAGRPTGNVVVGNRHSPLPREATHHRLRHALADAADRQLTRNWIERETPPPARYYVTDYLDDDVTVLDAGACNARGDLRLPSTRRRRP